MKLFLPCSLFGSQGGSAVLHFLFSSGSPPGGGVSESSFSQVLPAVARRAVQEAISWDPSWGDSEATS